MTLDRGGGGAVKLKKEEESSEFQCIMSNGHMGPSPPVDRMTDRRV